MYAVIRTGGKQYRVEPGDVLRVEKIAPENGKFEITDVLAATRGDGSRLVKPGTAKVLASVIEEGRNSKVLVFHFKRKKQYKKTQGHRQSFSQIRIDEIHVDGERYTAAK